MKSFLRVSKRLAAMLGRDRLDSDLATEIELHLQLQTEDNMRLGMSREEARRAAVLKFGAVESAKETYRDQRGMPGIEALAKDLRYAFRSIWKSPAATALSMLSIALGIGLTTSMFSLADAFLFRPLALDHPRDALTAVSIGDDGRPFLYGWQDYLDMAAASQGIAEISAYQRRGAMLASDEGSESVLAYVATPNHFSFLGVKAALGQTSLESVQGRPAVVISNRLWRRRFGSDPRTIGRTIVLSGKAFTVTGVLPAEFSGLVRTVANDVWMTTDAWFDVLGRVEERQSRFGQFEIVARLRPGVTTARAAAQLDAAIRGAGKHKPSPAGSAGTYLETKFALGWSVQLIYGSVMALVLGLVLFAGCANAAQLRLAQGESRKKEVAVRRALGASSQRIARLLLMETLIVTVAGAAAGVALAAFLMQEISEMISAGQPFIYAGMRMDARVLSFSLAATLVSVLLAGLAPMRHAVRVDLNDVLKSGQGLGRARGTRVRRGLVIAQISVTVLFFGMAVQSITSARNAAEVRPGIDPTKRVFVARVGPGWRWPAAQWAEQACQRLATLQGVRGATFARRLPLSGSGGGMTVRVELPGRQPLGLMLNNVAGNYFSVMGTRVLAGRGIEPADRAGTAPVMVVSQEFVRQVFGSRDPIGQWIMVDRKMRQVIGIAEDGPSNNLHEPPTPFLYLPFAQAPADDLTLMVETVGSPAEIASTVRQELKRFDPGMTVYSSITLAEHMDHALAPDRMLASVTMTLGIVGLLLTAAGLFGVVSYTVHQQTREIGLRVALGATPVDIRGLVLRDSLTMTAWGLPAGLLLVWAAARAANSVLLGVSELEPRTYLLSAAAVIGLGLVAAWLPAARAARLDPAVALRSE